MSHHYIVEGDTAQITVVGSVERVMLMLLDTVFAVARSVGYTDIHFSVRRGEEHWQRWTGDAPVHSHEEGVVR